MKQVNPIHISYTTTSEGITISEAEISDSKTQLYVVPCTSKEGCLRHPSVCYRERGFIYDTITKPSENYIVTSSGVCQPEVDKTLCLQQYNLLINSTYTPQNITSAPQSCIPNLENNETQVTCLVNPEQCQNSKASCNIIENFRTCNATNYCALNTSQVLTDSYNGFIDRSEAYCDIGSDNCLSQKLNEHFDLSHIYLKPCSTESDCGTGMRCAHETNDDVFPIVSVHGKGICVQKDCENDKYDDMGRCCTNATSAPNTSVFKGCNYTIYHGTGTYF